jgi:hypothetical protein
MQEKDNKEEEMAAAAAAGEEEDEEEGEEEGEEEDDSAYERALFEASALAAKRVFPLAAAAGAAAGDGADAGGGAGEGLQPQQLFAMQNLPVLSRADSELSILTSNADLDEVRLLVFLDQLILVDACLLFQLFTLPRLGGVAPPVGVGTLDCSRVPGWPPPRPAGGREAGPQTPRARPPARPPRRRCCWRTLRRCGGCG